MNLRRPLVTFLIFEILVTALPAAAQGNPITPGLTYDAGYAGITYHGTWTSSQLTISQEIDLEYILRSFYEYGYIAYDTTDTATVMETTDPAAYAELDVAHGGAATIDSMTIFAHQWSDQGRIQVCVETHCQEFDLATTVANGYAGFTVSLTGVVSADWMGALHVVVSNVSTGGEPVSLLGIHVQEGSFMTTWPTPIPWPFVEPTPFISLETSVGNGMTLAYQAINAYRWLNRSSLIDGIAVIVMIVIVAGFLLDTVRKFTGRH